MAGTTTLTQAQALALVRDLEDRRAVKNLMGRFTRALTQKEEEYIPARFWANRADICLGLNDGWYLGPSVERYFRACAARVRQSDALLKKRFPTLFADAPEQAYGFGQMELKGTSNDVVEIAADGATARGLWSCAGEEVRMTTAGPVSFWTFGTYAVDFIREGEWRIWHMEYLEEIDCPQGERWYQPGQDRPADPAFAEMARVPLPEPDVKEQLYPRYRRDRPFAVPPLPPEPYETFSEQDSYGYRREAHEG